jgi:hypothetical protein
LFKISFHHIYEELTLYKTFVILLLISNNMFEMGDKQPFARSTRQKLDQMPLMGCAGARHLTFNFEKKFRMKKVPRAGYVPICGRCPL